MALAVSIPLTVPTAGRPDASKPFGSLTLDELEELARNGDIADVKHLAEALGQAEAFRRRAHAVSIDLLATSEAAGLHYVDGHSSAKVMSRHVNKLSGAEATGRDRCRRMFADLLLVADAYRAGHLGTDQVMLLARVWANPRVRDAMQRRQARFLKDARRLSFPRFRARVLEWQRINDEDGAEPARDRAFENRNVQLVQNHFDESWDLAGIFTAGDGAMLKQVLDAYVKVLFEADWAEAKQRVGDGVCMSDLSRTPSQRRADAMKQIFADAIANEAGMSPIRSVHGALWSPEAFEEMVRRASGAEPRPFDPDTFRCETVDGLPLDPTEAFADALLNKIRRVVIDAKGVVLDMGVARSFTGLLREAVMMQGRECYWPGCWIPSSRCEADHLHEHSRQGRTNPGNGAPLCGRHNRWKQKGFRVWRDDTGQYHVHRPDGTVIA